MLKVLASLIILVFSNSVAWSAPQCSDIPPPPGTFSCQEQAAFGKCKETWMENYCALSCGKCENAAEKVACPGRSSSESEYPSRPSARSKDLPWMTVVDWCGRFQKNIQNPSRSGAQLVFIGDSITEGWPGRGGEVSEEYFKAYRPLFLGIGGDQTQQVLWRIENGELAGLDPKVLVLLIGVNNIGWGNWNELDTAAGIEAVLKALHQRFPNASILHHAIFPAMEKPDDGFRLKIKRTNEYLSKFQIPRVRYLDIASSFLNSDGTISSEVMYDFLHPDRQGYRRWAQALQPELKKIFAY